MRQFGAAVGCEGRKMWGWMDGSNEARVMEGGEMEGSCLLPCLVFANQESRNQKTLFSL